ncbi:hypothetical protein [Arenimonas composti]|nr:hypothetical protein [Arenimonas composti]
MNRRVVIALGGAGVNFVNSIAQLDADLAVAIIGSQDPEDDRYARFDHVWRVEVREEEGETDADLKGVPEDVRDRAFRIIGSADRIVFFVDFGGLISKFAPALCGLARNAKDQVFMLGTFPFVFEVPRRRVAENVLESLRSIGVPMCVEDNQSLVHLGPTMKAGDAFRVMNRRIEGHWRQFVASN